jgi:hypothetical protein
MYLAIDNPDLKIETVEIYGSWNNWTTPIYGKDYVYSDNSFYLYYINTLEKEILYKLKVGDEWFCLDDLLIDYSTGYLNNKIIVVEDDYCYNGKFKIKNCNSVGKIIINHGVVILVRDLDIINNDILDEYYNIYEKSQKINELLKIVFNKKEQYLKIKINDMLHKLNNEQQKYILHKLDDLPYAEKHKIIDLRYTRRELCNLANTSDISVGSRIAKDDLISKILDNFQVSLLVDVSNVYISKYYDEHLIEHEFYNQHSHSKLCSMI